MSNSDPEENVLNFLSLDLHPGILRANVIARRLESIIREAGEGISNKLYRNTRDAVLRGDYNFLTADDDIARMIGESWHTGRSAESLPARLPDIGVPEDPKALHELWSGLSQSEKADLYHADPFIGNRDGIPQEKRDKYNRSALQTLWERAQEAGDYQRAGNYDEIMKMLYTSERGQPPFYLSYIDDDWRFAFTLDNPDFADNAVILLNPAGIKYPVGYADETMRQIRQAALLVDPRAKTSVTLWGGYDNPRSMVQSVFPQFAEDGAAMARRYHEGLRFTHVGPPSHNTTIGHSYGSVLAGHAAGHGGALNTDELVFIGSWGTGVHNAGELSLTSVTPENTGDHVFATMAPRDSVQLMPKTHGPPPTDPGFGASVFSSGSAPGEYRWNPMDHFATNYLDSSNPAARNIGLIITGHGDMVT
ncbi:alpha/beta hydrolase [Nocardia sp. NBC_00403]|uniref:alpha/beta hydrolase n=1 Tax=Nocardia sp. NBC_00403 TaxID=2975990 RepID=UPI002E231274